MDWPTLDHITTTEIGQNLSYYTSAKLPTTGQTTALIAAHRLRSLIACALQALAADLEDPHDNPAGPGIRESIITDLRDYATGLDPESERWYRPNRWHTESDD